METKFFGRTFWLVKGSEYRLLIKFINFFGIKDPKIFISFAYDESYLLEKETLYYGLAHTQEDLPNTYPIRLFWQWKEKIYPIDRNSKICPNCHQHYVGYFARSYDLYQGTEDIDKAYEWGMNLPYITGCPNCGFEDNGGRRYLAIRFNDKIITDL